MEDAATEGRSGAGGNFSAEYSAVLHNDGDGGRSLPKSVDTGQIGFIDDIECTQQAASLWRTMTPFWILGSVLLSGVGCSNGRARERETSFDWQLMAHHRKLTGKADVSPRDRHGHFSSTIRLNFDSCALHKFSIVSSRGEPGVSSKIYPLRVSVSCARRVSRGN